MPKRNNRKADLGNYRPQSGAADIDNIFFTEEGWVYRHFKGDPRDPKTRYWDEIIVAGAVDTDDTENSPCLETLNAPTRKYLGLGPTVESNGYTATPNSAYGTDQIDFEEVVSHSAARVIGVTDGIFDIEYKNDFGSSGPGPGGCKDDSDCGPGEICSGGVCITDPTISPVGCSSDLDCPTGEICSGGVCVPDPSLIPGCLVDSDCGPGEICVGNVCVPAPPPPPANIGNVTVKGDDIDAVTPDTGSTHSYSYKIDGGSTDTLGTMSIEPASAGTITGVSVEWTTAGDHEVVFDVESPTAPDTPKQGRLGIKVTDPATPGLPYIGNVTISGPTNVTAGDYVTYTVSFDGTADRSRCYLEATSGNEHGYFWYGPYMTDNGEYEISGYIKNSDGLGTRTLSYDVKCRDEVAEPGWLASGTLDIDITDVTTRVTSMQWMGPNPAFKIPTGANSSYNPSPNPGEPDIHKGAPVRIQFSGTSQDYGTPRVEGLDPSDTYTLTFNRNDGPYDYWDLDFVWGNIGKRSVTVKAQGYSTRTLDNNLEIVTKLDQPFDTSTLLDVDSNHAPDQPGRYAGLTVMHNMNGALSGSVRTGINHGGKAQPSAGSDVTLVNHAKSGYGASIDLPYLEASRGETFGVNIRLNSASSTLPLTEIDASLDVLPLYPASQQENNGTAAKADFTGVTSDILMFSVSGMFQGDPYAPAQFWNPRVTWRKWGYGDNYGVVGGADNFFSLDAIELGHDEAVLDLVLDADFSGAPGLTKKHERLSYDPPADQSNGLHPTNNSYFCAFDGHPYNDTTKGNRIVKITATYNTGSFGRITKEAIIDFDHPGATINATDGWFERSDPAEYPQHYIDYRNSFPRP